MDERLQKTIAAITASGADFALLTSPDAVAYASGHVSAVEAGPSPFAGGPALAIIDRQGGCGLVITNLEAGTTSFAGEIVTYEGFSYQAPSDVFRNYLDAALSLMTRMGVGGRIAIEEDTFPHSLAGLLPEATFLPIEPALKQERAIKTPAEVMALREAALTASAGQKAFIENAREGMTELELFAAIRLAMESRAGERLPVTGDLISGKERTSAFMGWPSNRGLAKGDPLICDLAPRVDGYWGDSCASAMLGEATPRFHKLFKAAGEALDHAISTLRPGLQIAALDSALQAIIARNGYSYAHHSGHSIGTGVHEWPRIVGYEKAAFRENMVVMVEPTAFDPEIGGVRLEFMLHVTADGCAVLTNFSHQPEIRR